MTFVQTDHLVFRQVCENDLSFLVHLRRTTMRGHIEASGLVYDEAEQLKRVLDRYDCAAVIVHDGRDIGLLKVDRQKDPWEFIQFQILPECQHQGLGETILRQLLAEAGKAGVAVKLTVLKANPARRLYERVGFCAVGDAEQARTIMRTR